MKLKKITSCLCAMSILFTMNTTPVFAEQNASDTTAMAEVNMLSEEIGELSGTEQQEIDPSVKASIEELSKSLSTESLETVDVQAAMVGSVDLDNGILLGEVNAKGRSANSVTQQFTDYITSADDQRYITFGMAQGEILNATLANPANDNLNYDLILASVAEDGSLTVLKTSTLGTYVDPETGKTVDEGISYVHTGAEIGAYAIFVLSSSGSSTTESFTLTVSFDVAGSYDGYETNDSPFEAKSLSISGTTAGATASLHVANDQDWYAVSTTEGVYQVTSDNYDVEVYYATTGNRMVRAEKVSGNYVLDNGTHYVKVSSDAAVSDFTFGDYALSIENVSRYSTLETAFDLGDWEYSYTRTPSYIPDGQASAYYRFTIDGTDRAYASIQLSNLSTSAMIIEVLDASGEGWDYGFTGNSQLAARGVITKSSGQRYLVVDLNGNEIGNTGYLKVTRLSTNDFMADMAPSIDKRIYSGGDTFKFTGTASNTGNNYSTILTLNLTNNSKIPDGAIADAAYTTGTLSSSVGGVQHMLNPGGLIWVSSSSNTGSMAEHGSFDLSPYGVEVKQPWQFMYAQTAYASTTMKNVEIRFTWEYDINQTNYELFQ